MALRRDCGLLLGTEVQLVVSCTTIEAQVVFETLLALITGQLTIAGQLRREVHLWSIGLLLGSGGGDDLEEEFLADEATGDRFALFWGTVAELEVKAFPCFWE